MKSDDPNVLKGEEMYMKSIVIDSNKYRRVLTGQSMIEMVATFLKYIDEYEAAKLI